MEALLACRLIPLDKNPGVRPTGVAEIPKQVSGKFVIPATRNDVLTSVGSLQVCAGHNPGCGTLGQGMHSLHNEEKTEAVYY